MAIIQAVVDELEVAEGDGGRGTVVRMTKYLRRPLDAGRSRLTLLRTRRRFPAASRQRDGPTDGRR